MCMKSNWPQAQEGQPQKQKPFIPNKNMGLYGHYFYQWYFNQERFNLKGAKITPW